MGWVRGCQTGATLAAPIQSIGYACVAIADPIAGGFSLETTHFLEIVHQGWMTNYPLALGSIITLAVFFERLWRFRGLADDTKKLTRQAEIVWEVGEEFDISPRTAAYVHALRQIEAAMVARGTEQTYR